MDNGEAVRTDEGEFFSAGNQGSDKPIKKRNVRSARNPEDDIGPNETQSAVARIDGSSEKPRRGRKPGSGSKRNAKPAEEPGQLDLTTLAFYIALAHNFVGSIVLKTKAFDLEEDEANTIAEGFLRMCAEHEFVPSGKGMATIAFIATLATIEMSKFRLYREELKMKRLHNEAAQQKQNQQRPVEPARPMGPPPGSLNASMSSLAA